MVSEGGVRPSPLGTKITFNRAIAGIKTGLIMTLLLFIRAHLIARTTKRTTTKQKSKQSSHGTDNQMTMTRVPLPPGKLGVTFSGSPPMVTDVVPDSPMRGKLSIGDVIYGVSVPHRFKVHSVEDSSILSEVITKTAHLSRFLLLSHDDEHHDDANHLETEFHITLPSGRLGLTFEGDSQPTIAKVWDYCPVREFVHEGQWLKSVMIPTEPEPIACQHLSARDVYEVLRANGKRQGRVLVLTNPPLAVAEPVLASSSVMEENDSSSRRHFIPPLLPRQSRLIVVVIMAAARQEWMQRLSNRY